MTKDIKAIIDIINTEFDKDKLHRIRVNALRLENTKVISECYKRLIFLCSTTKELIALCKKYPSPPSEDVGLAIWNRRVKFLTDMLDAKSDFEIGFCVLIIEYEDTLEHKNQRKTLASYTRRAASEHGIKDYLIQLMKRPETYGYKVLEENNKLRDTFENLIIRHKKEFHDDIVKMARAKLTVVELD